MINSARILLLVRLSIVFIFLRELFVYKNLILFLIEVYGRVCLHENRLISNKTLLVFLSTIIINVALNPIFVFLVKDTLVMRNPILFIFIPILVDVLLIINCICGNRLLVVAWRLVWCGPILISVKVDTIFLILSSINCFKSFSLCFCSFFSSHVGFPNFVWVIICCSSLKLNVESFYHVLNNILFLVWILQLLLIKMQPIWFLFLSFEYFRNSQRLVVWE